jgi:hypothetical protein
VYSYPNGVLSFHFKIPRQPANHFTAIAAEVEFTAAQSSEQIRIGTLGPALTFNPFARASTPTIREISCTRAFASRALVFRDLS